MPNCFIIPTEEGDEVDYDDLEFHEQIWLFCPHHIQS